MMATLTQAWTTASAALPLGWRIAQVRLDLVMPDGTELWVASACEYDAQGFPQDARDDEPFANAWGSNPIEALLKLAEELRPIPGNQSA